VPSSLADVPPVDCGQTRLPFNECRAGSVRGKPPLANPVPTRRAVVVPAPHERHPLGLRAARSRVLRPVPASPSPTNILPAGLHGQGCIPSSSARVAPSTTRYRTPSPTKSPQHRTKHYTKPTPAHANMLNFTRDTPPTPTPMSPSILIQAGHSAAYPPHLPGGGGAAGEADWTTQLAARIADYLQASPTPPEHPTVTIVGSWAYYLPSPSHTRRFSHPYTSLPLPQKPPQRLHLIHQPALQRLHQPKHIGMQRRSCPQRPRPRPSRRVHRHLAQHLPHRYRHPPRSYRSLSPPTSSTTTPSWILPPAPQAS
jgi:hypothetical protein